MKKKFLIYFGIIIQAVAIFSGCENDGSNKVPFPAGQISVWTVNPELIDPDYNDGLFTISWDIEFNRTYNYSRYSFYIIEKNEVSLEDFQGDVYLGKGVLINKWENDYPDSPEFKTFQYDKNNHSVNFDDATGSVIRSLSGLSGQLYALGVSTVVMYSGRVVISYKTIEINFANAAVAVDGWESETVNQTGFYNSAIAVDSNNNPHIAYYKLNELRYTFKKNGVWDDMSVSGLNVVSDCNGSIYVDSGGRVHIGYSEKTSEGFVLKYASKYPDDDSWGFITIDESSAYVKNCSLYVDGGHVYILYSVGSLLKLAHENNSGWELEVIDDNAGDFSSLVIDSDNKMHISFQSDSSLKLISGNSDKWDDSVVIDAGIDTGYCNSIACDSQNFLHISYYDMDNGSLKYASDVSGVWRLKTLDPSVGNDDFLWNEPSTRILVSSDDTINILYYNFIGLDFMLARPSEDETRLFYVEALSDSGAWLSGCIDPDDNIHAAYYSMAGDSPRKLKYATGRSLQE